MLRREGHKGFCPGYGGFPLCDPCRRVTNESCAYSDKMIGGMSADCIDAAKLTEKCGLEFTWLPEKLFLFGMFIFVEEGTKTKTESCEFRPYVRLTFGRFVL